MTVYTTKPAINLREELASLRNQGGYSEQQFYFDGLVANGTFDSALTGWVLTAGESATQAIVGGRLRLTSGPSRGRTNYSFPTIKGNSYLLAVQKFIGTAPLLTNLQVKAPGVTDTTNANDITIPFVATSTTTGITLQVEVGSSYGEFDNVSVFETDGTDVIHTMPKGWKPKDVFEDGLLQREGAANDYTVVYDGFDYYVKPTVAPSATTQTCVIGVRA